MDCKPTQRNQKRSWFPSLLRIVCPLFALLPHNSLSFFLWADLPGSSLSQSLAPIHCPAHYCTPLPSLPSYSLIRTRTHIPIYTFTLSFLPVSVLRTFPPPSLIPAYYLLASPSIQDWAWFLKRAKTETRDNTHPAHTVV